MMYQAIDRWRYLEEFSTFRVYMDHYFVLWRHTQFLFTGFSSGFSFVLVFVVQ